MGEVTLYNVRTFDPTFHKLAGRWQTRGRFVAASAGRAATRVGLKATRAAVEGQPHGLNDAAWDARSVLAVTAWATSTRVASAVPVAEPQRLTHDF